MSNGFNKRGRPLAVSGQVGGPFYRMICYASARLLKIDQSKNNPKTTPNVDASRTPHSGQEPNKSMNSSIPSAPITTRNTALNVAIIASTWNVIGVRDARAENHNKTARITRAEAAHHIPEPTINSRTEDKTSDGNMMAETEATSINTENIAKRIDMFYRP